jgi:hypothetical protein
MQACGYWLRIDRAAIAANGTYLHRRCVGIVRRVYKLADSFENQAAHSPEKERAIVLFVPTDEIACNRS